MIDESMDKEAMKLPPQPWEYRSKPAWQRLLVIAGGVLFNFILAIIIYSGIMLVWGQSYIKNTDVTTGIYADSLATEIGFKTGDKILQIEDVVPDDFHDNWINIVRLQAKYAKVLRNNDTVTVNIDPVFIPAILKNPRMFDYGFPFMIGDRKSVV